MRDDVAAFDGVAVNQIGHRRINDALVVDKVTHTFVFKKCDAPSVAMVARVACPLRKAGEAERYVRGGVAIHPEKLAPMSDVTVVVARYSGREMVDLWLAFARIIQPGF